MTLPKNILYPVDFSDRCRAFWPVVESAARQLDAHVTLFHVLDEGPFEAPEDLNKFEGVRQELWKKLEGFPGGVGERAGVSRELAQGNPAECIAGRTVRMNAPLIMMPTRGRSRFRQLLLGSVTASVLHDSTCPVWTQAHVEDPPPYTAAIASIVCAIDMGPQSAGVLMAALAFSNLFGSSLHVVHSVPGIDPRFPSATADRAHQFLLDKAIEEFPAHCRNTGVDLRMEIAEEVGLVDGIVAAARRYGADLLVIGRGSIQGPLGRLRTNAHQLILHSPCAVLSV